jgi:hypothetical protein
MSGTLTTGDPTWDRPSCTAYSGNTEWYDWYEFTVSVTGTYDIEIVGLTGDLDDPYYLLYEDSFNPADPFTNCIAADDDGGSYSELASGLSVNLTAGTTYILVTTQCCDGTTPGEDDGGYTNRIQLVLAEEEAAPVEPPPGPDMVPIPAGAVVGTFTEATALLYAPAADATTDTVITPGKTLWVFGLDASGMYYQVIMSGGYYWVPVGNIGPTYDDVWNGTPLPTEVVE